MRLQIPRSPGAAGDGKAATPRGPQRQDEAARAATTARPGGIGLQLAGAPGTPEDTLGPPRSIAAPVVFRQVAPLVQRECGCAGPAPCAPCAPPGGGGLAAVPTAVADEIARPGQALDARVRARFEERLGIPLDHVRVHTDGRAADSARAIQANAYTVGHHVVFDRGRYDPDSRAGRRLLGHELVHVAQQRRGLAASGPISNPDDPAEKEADRLSEQLADESGPAVLRATLAPEERALLGLVQRQGPPGSPSPAAPACGTQARPPFDPQRLIERRGELEHLLVQIDFMGQAGRTPRAEYSIPGASKKGTGHTGYADIVDLASKEVFEIKPDHLVAMAQTEAANYATAMSSTCGLGPFTAGKSYKPGKNPIWEFRSGSTYIRLVASFGGAGAVLYRWEWGGLQTKWSDEWVKIWARATALQTLFGRDLLDASGKAIQSFGKGAAPALEAFGYARAAKAAVQTLNAALRSNADFLNGITHDIGQQAAAMTGSKIVMYMPEAAFALSAAGQAIVASQIQMMQVQTNPQVNAYRAALGAVIAAMGAGYAIAITGAVGFAWGAGVATTMGAVATTATVPTVTATAPAWAPALANFGTAMAGAAAGAMLLFWPSQAAAQPAVESGRMQYVVVPPLQSIASIPGTAIINGVNHVQIGVAEVP